jgi:hypothetical protein
LRGLVTACAVMSGVMGHAKLPSPSQSMYGHIFAELCTADPPIRPNS